MFYTKWGQRFSLDKIEGLGKTTLRILPTYNAQSNNKLLVTCAICIITTKGIEIAYVRMGALTRLLQGKSQDIIPYHNQKFPSEWSCSRVARL